MASSVTTINSLLSQFTAANNAVVSGLQAGANVASAQDQRDSIVTQLSQQIGVSTITAANGSMSIYTDSGVTLFQDTARTVAFTPTPTLVDGQAVRPSPSTASRSPARIRRCRSSRARSRATPRCATRSRPNIRPSSTRSPAASSTPSRRAISPRRRRSPRCPASSPRPAQQACPRCRRRPASPRRSKSIPTSIPSPGGDATLLRDGGISNPGNPAYTYNSTGAASYTGRIQQLVGAIGATQSFDPSAGLGASASLTDYANASVSWLQGENSQASNASSYQNALATQATSALSNATGVNLDAEMTNMLNLENSYASSAKLLTTVNSMFSALLNAA